MRRMLTREQRSEGLACPTLDMLTLERDLTEPRPISASRTDDLGVYDARFAAVRDRLVRICAGFIGADEAEDVVHDAYLRGRTRIAQLRDDDLFEPWMTRIAINLCMNRHRSLRTLRDLLPALLSRRAASDRDLGLLDLVERLPPRERTVLVLHYAYGYRLEEIARMSGLSAVNVRTIVFRARRRLADRVREADG